MDFQRKPIEVKNARAACVPEEWDCLSGLPAEYLHFVGRNVWTGSRDDGKTNRELMEFMQWLTGRKRGKENDGLPIIRMVVKKKLALAADGDSRAPRIFFGRAVFEAWLRWRRGR